MTRESRPSRRTIITTGTTMALAAGALGAPAAQAGTQDRPEPVGPHPAMITSNAAGAW